jgi:hypothetical protein
MEKLRYRFYTGANESAVSQIILAFKIKIHAGILQSNNRYNDLCLQNSMSQTEDVEPDQNTNDKRKKQNVETSELEHASNCGCGH